LQRQSTRVPTAVHFVAVIRSVRNLVREQGWRAPHRLHVWRVHAAKLVQASRRGLSVLLTVTGLRVVGDGSVARLAEVELHVDGAS